MRLYYYKAPKKNFGDDLNPWLFDKILPGYFDNDDKILMSGIGTIIHDDMPEAQLKIVFTSGAGQGFLPTSFGDKSWHISCVRGPLSASVLGLSQDKAITDGAILLASLDCFKPLPIEEREGVVFMPHEACLEYGRWEQVCQSAGIKFLSPRADLLDNLYAIRSAKLMLADSMHAAIVADTFRVPWIAVIASPLMNQFKWLDWSLSMNLAYRPVIISPSSASEAAAKSIYALFGGLYPKGDTHENAIASYFKVFKHDTKFRWELSRKIRKLAILISSKYLLMVQKCFIAKRLEEKYFLKAADDLRKLSTQQGNLSDTDIYKHKIYQLRMKLLDIQTFVEKKLAEGI
ncbi:MAG: hypothetical protein IPH06_13990 [Alphaproteobacteria bacterium]|nr:hypothetical protein [Alphaproteobacteria bacterium]